LPEIGRALEAVIVSATTTRCRASAIASRSTSPACARLLVRARRRGDRFGPSGAAIAGSKSFLIDAKIPRWTATGGPLVDAGRDILWVAGVRRGAGRPVHRAHRRRGRARLVPLA